MGSMNARIVQRPLLGSGVLYSHDKLLPLDGMMVTVGQHWYQNSHVLCPGLCALSTPQRTQCHQESVMHTVLSNS